MGTLVEEIGLLRTEIQRLEAMILFVSRDRDALLGLVELSLDERGELLGRMREMKQKQTENGE
tara:strand:- start:1757 stop:1945 length:189 start_codon:yes stop_codon:yes gene_type:complete